MKTDLVIKCNSWEFDMGVILLLKFILIHEYISKWMKESGWNTKLNKDAICLKFTSL